MGTDMGSIQWAYQGFAKQNYTMLDNLKLGYGGTKSEMERLVKDAAKLDKSIDANSLSYGNIVKAIHAVQVNMDIYGTTQKEAEHTITGSLNSMKSAWGNLLTAMASGENIDQCIDNMVSAVEIFGDNVIPIAEKALGGIGKVIDKLAPKIADELPKLAKKLLPPLIKAAVELTKGLIKALPSLIKTVATTIVDIFGEQFPIFKKIGDFLKRNANNIAKSIKVITIAVIGLVGAFKGFKAVKSISSVFGGLKGGKGGNGGLLSSFQSLAQMKTTTVLKGVANLAIIIGALGALLYIATKVFKNGVDFKEMFQVIILVAALGAVGIALAKFAGTVGNIPFLTVLKGVLNISIVIVAMGALLWLATKVFSGGVNFKEMLQVIALIGLFGTVGSVLALFAGLIGIIPFPVVLSGLLNIGLVLAGITVLIEAFGLLSQIPGFNYFLEKGGEVLVKICNILGEMVGSLIGGFGEGVSNSLPVIGQNISDFITNLKPAFDMFGGADMSGIGEFFKAIGAFLVQIAANNILSVFTGGLNLGSLATELNDFATNSKDFFNTVATLPENGLTNATALFKCLAGLNELPKEGGIGSWFTGGLDFGKLKSGLEQLSSESVINFFNTISGLEQTAFDKATALFSCLGGMKDLPKEGGIGSWFAGGLDFGKLAAGLGQLSSETVINFFNTVSGFEQKAFDNATALFNCLAGMKDLPKEGGVGSWFAGGLDFGKLADGLGKLASEDVTKFFSMVQGLTPEVFDKTKTLFNTLSEMSGKEGGFWDAITGKKSKLAAIAEDLGNFATETKTFFEQVNNLNTDKLNNLWDSLKKADGITADIVKNVDGDIDKIVKKVSDLPKQMGDAIKNSGESLSSGLVDVWKEAVKASVAPVNKVLDAANWILKEFGSKKRVITWQPYANGTNGHKGGNALVNDGNGAELVQMPNGNMFIPHGKNVLLPNAPKGMKVLPADRTARLMGKKSATFNYADGIGDVDLWSYYDNEKGLVDKIAESVSYDGMSGFASALGKGMVSTFTGEMTAWLKKLFEEEGAMSIANYVPSKGVEQWRSTVIRALKMEGQYSAANVARTLYQMKTESGGNPKAINLWDSNAKRGIPSKGLMQCIDPTFNAYARAGFNKNIYDPLSNILASIRYAVARYGSLANAYQGHGYAKGVGKITMPEQPSTMNLSYSPDSGGVSCNSSVENNTYAPQFTLNISGTSDDRTMARKVKRWIREAWDEMLNDYEYKTPKTQEV